MEDNPPNTSPSNPPPARTAETLRELHERTRAAIEAQRARMSELEANLTSQLDAIAGQIAEQVSAHTGGEIHVAVPDQQALDEISRLRIELEKTRAEWNAERNAWEADRLRLMSDDRERSQGLDVRQADIESRQQALDERAIQLNHRDRELCQRQALLDSYSTQCASQQQQLTDLEGKLAKEREELSNNQAEVRATQSLNQHQLDELATREQAVQRDEATLAADRAMLEAEQNAFNAERETFAVEREVFRTQQAEAVAANSTSEELSAKLAELEREWAAGRESLENELSTVRSERRDLEVERDELASALAASRGELKAAKMDAGAVEERDELRQKFDIALEDLQRLRSRIAELEQELATRPAANDTDSVELVQLRAERDALAQRVTQLEQQPVATVDSDAAQEMADLQRRFELAVEDVRDLKKQNASLELRLTEAHSRAGSADSSAKPSSSGGGSSSWELMKQEMLANLEDEGDGGDEERTRERETIENTIHITDEVIANKDREIAALKLQISEGGAAATAPVEEQFREQIDADEVVRQHRERTAALEQEMQEKLRAAELELSVERAKIAREQAHLADLQAEIDSQRVQDGHGRGGGGGSAQAPKRRWLSKLGLSGDEEE